MEEPPVFRLVPDVLMRILGEEYRSDIDKLLDTRRYLEKPRPHPRLPVGSLVANARQVCKRWNWVVGNNPRQFHLTLVLPPRVNYFNESISTYQTWLTESKGCGIHLKFRSPFQYRLPEEVFDGQDVFEWLAPYSSQIRSITFLSSEIRVPTMPFGPFNLHAIDDHDHRQKREIMEQAFRGLENISKLNMPELKFLDVYYHSPGSNPPPIPLPFQSLALQSLHLTSCEYWRLHSPAMSSVIEIKLDISQLPPPHIVAAGISGARSLKLLTLKSPPEPFPRSTQPVPNTRYELPALAHVSLEATAPYIVHFLRHLQLPSLRNLRAEVLKWQPLPPDPHDIHGNRQNQNVNHQPPVNTPIVFLAPISCLVLKALTLDLIYEVLSRLEMPTLQFLRIDNHQDLRSRIEDTNTPLNGLQFPRLQEIIIHNKPGVALRFLRALQNTKIPTLILEIVRGDNTNWKSSAPLIGLEITHLALKEYHQSLASVLKRPTLIHDPTNPDAEPRELAYQPCMSAVLIPLVADENIRELTLYGASEAIDEMEEEDKFMFLSVETLNIKFDKEADWESCAPKTLRWFPKLKTLNVVFTENGNYLGETGIPNLSWLMAEKVPIDPLDPSSELVFPLPNLQHLRIQCHESIDMKEVVATLRALAKLKKYTGQPLKVIEIFPPVAEYSVESIARNVDRFVNPGVPHVGSATAYAWETYFTNTPLHDYAFIL